MERRQGLAADGGHLTRRQGTDDLGVHAVERVEGRRWIVLVVHASAARRAESGGRVRPCLECGNGVGKAVDIARGDQHTGPTDEEVRQPSDSGGDHRDAGDHGLERSQRKALPRAAENGDVERGHQPARLCSFARPDQTIGNPQVFGEVLEVGASRAVTDSADRHVPVVSDESRRRPQQDLVVLLRPEAGDDAHHERRGGEGELSPCGAA